MKILLILCLALSGVFAPAWGDGQDIEGLLKRLESPDKQVRDSAVAALAKLGPGELDVIFFNATIFLGPRFKKLNDEGKLFQDDPVLLRIFDDLEQALAAMGPAAAAEIAKLGTSGNIDLERELCLGALEKMGPQGRKAIPILRKALFSENQHAQWSGMVGLVFVEGPGFPTLLEAARSPSEDIRSTAVIGLGRTHSPIAVEPVLAALKDENSLVQDSARDALGELGPLSVPAIPEILAAEYAENWIPLDKMGETAVPPLKELLLKGRSPICDRAGVALARAGGRGLPALSDALGHTDPAVRRAAVSALSAVDGDKKFVAAGLAKAWKDSDPSVREAALASMGAAGDAGGSLVPMFTAGLKDPSAPERVRSAMALAQLGRRAGSSAAGLFAALADSEAGVRSAAAQALALVGAEPAGAVPKLLGLVKDPMAEVRQGAVFALGTLDSGSAGLNAILQALEDADRKVALEAVMGLWRFGSEVQTVKPVLLRRLDSSDKEFCLAALETLQKLGILSEAKAGLIKLMKSPHRDVRYAAIDGIYKTGFPSEAKVLLEKLQKDDPDQGVREQAGFVLEGYRKDLTIPLPPPPPPYAFPPSAPMFRKQGA